MFWCSCVQVFRVNDILDGQKGDQGGGPKKLAKIQHGVKQDIFKITQLADVVPTVQILDIPVPQMVEQLLGVFLAPRHADAS